MKVLYYITIVLIGGLALGTGYFGAMLGGIVILFTTIGIIIQVILASICGNYAMKKGGSYYGIFVLTFWIPILGLVVALLHSLKGEKEIIIIHKDANGNILEQKTNSNS